ncbi:MAG: 30S ribosomal protein S9 [Candidatus Omnitrophica bacterium 4484_213]|nr:MAG: 30S ribosomal protein S9 [Candidatus Omnitrophica bacterium 4484_213]
MAEIKDNKKIKTDTKRRKSKAANKAKPGKECWATGKRKEAIARVKLIPQNKGSIVVNHRPMEDYFPLFRWQKLIKQPLVLTNSLNRYEIVVNVKGGGVSGQVGAVRQGLSRVLAKADSELRPILKKEGLLRRDSRQKERKKYGQRGARAKFQFTKR